jgi:hypothetical protein
MYSYIKRVNTNSIFGTNGLVPRIPCPLTTCPSEFYDVLISMEEP